MSPYRVAARIVAGMLGALGLVLATGAPAFAATKTFAAPVYASDFPDPSIMLVNGTYWAFATGSAGRNLQVTRSADLTRWSAPVDPLPVLPAWASPGLTWAPGVVQQGTTFLMYYTVHSRSLNRQCISVATTTDLRRPFTDNSVGPLICQADHGGSIDPNPYVDPASGNLYLLWKSDDNALGTGHPTNIWGQQLAPDGRSMAGGTAPSLLLTQSAGWQSPSAEGPTVLWQGGRYYLFYGANNYDTARSAIGFATSTTLLGAYADQSVAAPWLATRGSAQGPQGPAVFVDAAGRLRMAFAAWYGVVGYENGGGRSLWIGNLGFTAAGVPVLS
jgi:beta-xylosidase